jgi:hypothetical protein
MSGREVAESIWRDWSSSSSPPPPYWPFWSWTSAERRWSQLARVKIRRRPHPRPWEGPQMSFDGIGRSFSAQRIGLYAGARISMESDGETLRLACTMPPWQP